MGGDPDRPVFPVEGPAAVPAHDDERIEPEGMGDPSSVADPEVLGEELYGP